jgi:hypothetical protein
MLELESYEDIRGGAGASGNQVEATINIELIEKELRSP